MSRASAGVAAQDSVVRFQSAANRELTEHVNKLIIVEAEFTNAAQTFTLPKATGSGDTIDILNNIVQTQSFVVAALGLDILRGTAWVGSETATSSDVFHTTATSDKYTFNITTTGGLRGDRVQAWDVAAGVWQVQIIANGSGTLATGFTET